MPTRTRLLLLATLLAVAIGLLLAAVFGPRFLRGEPGLELPSSLPSLPEVGEPSGSQDPSGSSGPRTEVLLAVGDIGSCGSRADDAVADLAARLPGTIAVLGDVAYDEGSDEQFAECFDPSWGPMKDRLRPAPGNHEYRTPGAAGYFDYFGRTAGDRGEGWYSYDLGAWHVVVLNSNCDDVGCDPGSAQLDWLESDLADASASCLLAYWHAPRYSSGRHGSQEFVQPFWDALERAGVDVILNGHDHTYERVEVDGVRQFIAGTGGKSLYPFERGPLPQTEVRSDSAYGLLWLALEPDAYRWQFIGLGDSGFEDAGSGDCGSP